MAFGRTIKNLFFALVLFLCFWLWKNHFLNFVEAAEEWPICGSSKRITCIVDGDTFWYQSIKYRVVGINAPETGQARCAKEKKAGAKATLALQSFFNNHSVKISAGGLDKYRRTLAEIWIDDKPLVDLMVDSNNAIPYERNNKNYWCER